MYNPYDEEHYYNWETPYYNQTTLPSQTTTVKSSKKLDPDSEESYDLVLMTKKQQFDNVNNMVTQTLTRNMILLEPQVRMKMLHMMAIAGDQEIFGKLIIEEEQGYLVVKDIFIPEQGVKSAKFDCFTEQSARWRYSLYFKDFDPKKDDNGKAQGERRENDEVKYWLEHQLGHFHSHNSLGIKSSDIVRTGMNGKPRPSGTDTDDMMKQLQGKPYWVEIIGTFEGFSGRLMMDKPVKIKTELEVVEKWWSGIQSTMKETEGKIYYNKGEKRTSYKSTKKDDDKKVIEVTSKRDESWVRVFLDGGGFRWKRVYELSNSELLAVQQQGIYDVSTEINRRYEEYDNEDKSGKESAEEKDDTKEEKDYTSYEPIDILMTEKRVNWIPVEWDKENPVYISTDMISKEDQDKIAQLFELMLAEGEKIVVEVWRSNDIDIAIHDEQGWVCTLIGRMENEYPEVYKMLEDFCEYYRMDTEFNYVMDEDEMMYEVPRTTTFTEEAQKLTNEQIIKILEQHDIYYTSLEEDDDLMEQIMSGAI